MINELWKSMGDGNITTLRAELNFFSPSSAVVIYTTWALFCWIPLLFLRASGGLHCAQILSIPATQLSLKVILSSYGRESLEEHIQNLLWCRVAQYLPEYSRWIQELDGGIQERNLLMPLKVQHLSTEKDVLSGCQWLMTVICWPGRRDTILSYFCEGCEGAGDEKTFHTSLLLCDQKQPDLSLAMSINLGKVCEHFIMNQTMIFKIFFIISYC